MPFSVIADAIYDIGLPPKGCSVEEDLAWDLECTAAFEYAGWVEQEFWDEYYIRKAQDEIMDMTG